MMQTNTLSSPDIANPDFLWRNGELVPWDTATVHVNAVGHASVASVFEGIKAYRSERGDEFLVFRMREHMQRFVDSARLARLSLGFDAEALGQAALELLHRNRSSVDTYIRPWCFVRGIVRQLLVSEGAPAEVLIDSWPFTSSLETEREARAGISSWRRIEDQVMPPRMKAFSNYHNARLAMLEARRNGFDSAIMLDREGKITEGPASCVAMVRDRVVITPPVTGSILESVTRDTLLTLAREELSLPVLERPIDRSELPLASEAFFMGTAWELLPIVAVDGLTLGNGAMGPVTRGLDRCYSNLVRGRVEDRRGWITHLAI